MNIFVRLKLLFSRKQEQLQACPVYCPTPFLYEDIKQSQYPQNEKKSKKSKKGCFWKNKLID